MKLNKNKIYEWRCYCPLCNKIMLIQEKGNASHSKCPFCYHHLVLGDFIGEVKYDK